MQAIHRSSARAAALALACAACAVAPIASANSGMLVFRGELTDATCKVEGVDKAGQASFTVQLPTLSAAQFDMVGLMGGHTRFGLQLKDCAAVGTGVQVYFEGGPHLDSASNTLFASNGGPVQFALLNEDGTRVPIGQQAQEWGPVYAANGRMYFDVAYLRARTGPIVPGVFEGIVTYSLHYL